MRGQVACRGFSKETVVWMQEFQFHFFTEFPPSGSRVFSMAIPACGDEGAEVALAVHHTLPL